MIKVCGLSKYYGSRKAIKDLSFSLKKGEVLGLLGPNGAGKTTTMQIITGCLASSDGFVQIDGHKTVDKPLYIKSKIGYLPETPPLYEEMSVEKYLLYVSCLKGVSKAQRNSQVEKALKEVDLISVRSRMIGHLSKGYKQRVGLAGAIVSDPEILILDEPTVGLDPAQVIEIRELIHQSKANRAVIISSHILSEIEANCDRVLIINEGEKVSEGSLADLKKQVQNKKIQIRVRNTSPALIDHLKKVKGVLAVKKERDGNTYSIQINQDNNGDLARVVINQGADLIEMRENQASLEDIFIHLTQK